jgi:hypothetical protein
MDPEPSAAQPATPDETIEPVARAAVNEEPMLYCPACNQHLEQHKCKLVCSRCGYYMSCADYY